MSDDRPAAPSECIACKFSGSDERDAARAEVEKFRAALEYAELNTSFCEDHANGINVPFCTNECEIKREARKALENKCP